MLLRRSAIRRFAIIDRKSVFCLTGEAFNRVYVVAIGAFCICFGVAVSCDNKKTELQLALQLRILSRAKWVMGDTFLAPTINNVIRL